MSRLKIRTKSQAQELVDNMYAGMERRIAASPSGLCPIDVTLSFLPEGATLQMTSFVDGVNASRMAMDYRMEKTSVNKNTKLHISMVRNGGFAGVVGN